MEDLLTYARTKPEAMRALPLVDHEILRYPRDFIGHVLATIIGESFDVWVDERVRERNAKYKEEHDCQIELDEEVAAIY